MLEVNAPLALLAGALADKHLLEGCDPRGDRNDV
jgi:hypothetical protein